MNKFEIKGNKHTLKCEYYEGDDPFINGKLYTQYYDNHIVMIQRIVTIGNKYITAAQINYQTKETIRMSER